MQLAQSRDYSAGNDPVWGDGNVGIRFRQSAYIRDQLALLMRTRCQICHGFGHSKKKCLVDKQVRSALSFSRIATSKYSSAKTRVIVENAAHLQAAARVVRPPVAIAPPRQGGVNCVTF